MKKSENECNWAAKVQHQASGSLLQLAWQRRGSATLGILIGTQAWQHTQAQHRKFCLRASATPEPPLKRSFVTFDRGGQTGPPRSNDFFFGAADDTRPAADRPRPSDNRPRYQ